MSDTMKTALAVALTIAVTLSACVRPDLGSRTPSPLPVKADACNTECQQWLNRDWVRR